MLDVYDKHLHLVAEWKLPLLPKHHLMVRLIIRQLTQGNALGYAVFLDESLNKCLKNTLKWCKQQAFETLAFPKMDHVLGRCAKPRKPDRF